jgi:two-component system, OmpR family, sensor histidine kinase KdpD
MSPQPLPLAPVRTEPVRKRLALMRLVRANAIPVLISLALVVLATEWLSVLQEFTRLDLVTLFYLLPVLFAAARWGIVPAVVAAIAGAAAADFFFYPPLYSFWVQDPRHAIDIVVFLFVAVVTGDLAARLKREADALRRREAEMRELYAFSQRLAACFGSTDLIFAVQDYLSNTLGCSAFLIAHSAPVEHAGGARDSLPEAVRQSALALPATQAPQTCRIADAATGHTWLISTVAQAAGHGAIAVDLGRAAGDDLEAIERRVEALLREADKTLQHLKIAEAIEQARLKQQADALKDALVGGVSHELRTPLASITGSASVLAETPAVRGDPRSRDLVEAIQDQAGQLDADIRNLLDATRITAQGIRPHLEWTDPTDIVHAAVGQKSRRLAEHPVHVDVAGDLPLLKLDSGLVEQALAQVLDNAAKYSPAGAPVTVSARSEGGHVVFSVTDKGAGLTQDEKSQFGRRSFRGQRHTLAPGAGLGLWVASTLIATNGGTLDAASPGADRGTTVTIRLPVSAEAAGAAEAADD